MTIRSIWSAHRGLFTACFFPFVASLGACGQEAVEPAGMAEQSASPAAAMTAAPSGASGSGAASKPTASTSAPAGATAKEPTSAQTATPAATPTAAAGAKATTTATVMPPAAGAAASGDVAPDSTPAAAAGSGGTPAMSAAAGAGGSMAAAGSGGADSTPAHEDEGKGDGSDVITIGDSWMSNTLGTGDAIQGALQRLNMQPYRHYAVQGVMLMSASAFGPAIPTQYQTAKRVNPDIKTVVMTGGGNDIIQNPTIQASCNEGGQDCVDLLNRISDTLNELWTEMAADGVKDVVYIRYSKDAGSTSDKVRGMQKPIEVCTSGKIRCHSIDSTEAVMAELQDGIHPTRAANDRLAKVIWAVMEKEGVRR